MGKRILQVIGAGAAVAAGTVTALLARADTFPPIAGMTITWPWAIAIGAGVLIAPYIIAGLIRTILKQLTKAHTFDIIAASGGLFIGLLLAVLLTFPLSQVQFWHLNYWLPSLAAVIFGYLGVAVSVLRRNDIQRILGSIFRHRDRQAETELDGEEKTSARKRGKKEAIPAAEHVTEPKILLDTSAIIDGRIAEISRTGFIMGTLVAPRFVLEELQRIADSADSLRRNRGRRGLDILNGLQKEESVHIEIADTDYDNIHEVDAKLVKLARQLNTPIITNDYNLNKVAEFQGVKVLNINDLANSVKPALLPGEDMEVRVIQEGKEFNQGVAYLPDGTMIVVDGGKTFLNADVEVTVTRVLQTAAGRMIFAHIKQPSSAGVARKTS